MDKDKKKISLLLSIDIKNTYDRIIKRSKEYHATFALKRTRDHFNDIFTNRYKEFHVEDLKLLDDETLVAVDQYYLKVDEIYWYLKHTEDMPKMVEDRVTHQVKDLHMLYETAVLYLNAEQSGQSEELL